jgi:hypothetical protein
MSDLQLHELPAEKVKQFALAGKATVTVQSRTSGKHFTYRIVRSRPSKKYPNPVHFVSVLTGPENTKDYTLMGMIFADGNFALPRNPRIGGDAPSVQAFNWLWRSSPENLARNSQVFHHGHCARCGRKITNPDSLTSGYGPECASKLGL